MALEQGHQRLHPGEELSLFRCHEEEQAARAPPFPAGSSILDCSAELLQELHKGGATLCMVTHDPAHAKLATRTVSLFDGRVVQDELSR